MFFSVLQFSRANDHADFITEVADTFMTLGHVNSALKYYYMLENDDGVDDVRQAIFSLSTSCFIHLFSLSLASFLPTAKNVALYVYFL